MTTKPRLNIFRDKGKLAGKGLVYLAAGLLLVGWLLNTPSGILGKADAVGYAVCHRIDERSFHIGDRPISLCARCTGMFVGAMIGIIYLSILGRRRTEWPPINILVMLGVFLVSWGVDGFNSVYIMYFQDVLLYEPTNTLRLITGTGMGLVIAIALLPAFNQTIWKEYSRRSVIENWRQFSGLLAVSGISILLILTESPIFLYPFTLISALGVIVLLTMIYSLLLLILFRKENQITKNIQLIYPLTGGFIVALTQIILIDIGRYLLTGSWDGFHLFLG